jgi:NADH-quinone oxidoreductase subunit B
MGVRRRLTTYVLSGATGRHALANESNAFPEAFATTRLADAVNWARKYSFFPFPFVTACCGMEYFSVAGPRYDIDRFGAALPRFTPRQADLLFVVGTINQKQAPILRRVYEQMTEPKWVVSFGACTSSGGPYDNYAVLQGIDRVVPVHLYIPGCPPRPEAVLDGLMKLQNRVQHERPGQAWDGLELHGSGRKID